MIKLKSEVSHDFWLSVRLSSLSYLRMLFLIDFAKVSLSNSLESSDFILVKGGINLLGKFQKMSANCVFNIKLKSLLLGGDIRGWGQHFCFFVRQMLKQTFCVLD